MKTTLTDRAVKAAKADMADAVVPGLILRVFPSGERSYALVARYPGSSNPTRRSLGKHGALSLAQARDKARAWLELLARGIDPAHELEREKAEAARKRTDTVAAICEAWLEHKVIGKQRQEARAVSNVRDIVIPMFGHRPVGELTHVEVSTALRAIELHGTDHGLVKLGVRKELRRPGRAKKPSPMQARNLFVYLDGALRWAARTGEYGIDVSPLARVSKAERFGEAPRRSRWLSENELGCAWRASGTLLAPYRQMYRLLMLTGLRLSEVREAEWDEFDLKRKEWTIPAARMKGRERKASEHVVPLSKDMIRVLGELVRGPRGPFVFSTNGGASAIIAGGRFKVMLDEAMAHDQRCHKVKHFTNHDLRRTLRTLGRKIGIAADVLEAMLAHKRTGVEGIYDHHDRLDERRAAHETWAEFLIKCAKDGEKVVRLRKAS